jgi:hypothetical protein
MSRKFLTGIDLTGQLAQNMASPSASTDGANKAYVDSLVHGLTWKDEVRAASTANVTLATGVENGDTLDGVTLATGNRILLKNQTAGAENGIWVVNASGAPTRATDADTTTELDQATVRVNEGSVNGDTQWTQTAIVTTVGTTPQTWVASGGGISYTADGNGLELSGTTFSLELDGTSLSKSSSGVKVADAFVTALAGAGLTEASQVLAVGAGTGITVNANDVAVDTSVVVRKYSATYGNGSATTFNITPGLGTQFLTFTITNASTGEVVDADVTIPPAGTTLDITHAVAPSTNAYRITIHG